jgi:hypothetical protein
MIMMKWMVVVIPLNGFQVKTVLLNDSWIYKKGISFVEC